MKIDDKAISQILGATLLLLIGLAILSMVYMYVLTYPLPNPGPNVDIVGSIEDGNIVLTHRGGDPLDFTTEVMLMIGGIPTNIAVGDGDYLDNESKGNGQWDIGEQLVYTPSGDITDLQVEVVVIDRIGDSILMTGVVQEGIMEIPTVITLDATNVDEEDATLNMDYDFKFYTGSVRFIYREDKWTSMADTPNKVKEGGSLTYDGNDIYALRGDDYQDFWKYDITSDTWISMADTPYKVKWGGSLTYDGNDIYALRGDDYQDFWKYDITSNTWSPMANTPDKVKEGGSLTYDGTNIYALRGKDTQEFWKYDITSNTWSPMANTPDKVKDGGSLTYDGNDIYALRGDDYQDFWKYDITSNTWSPMANTPDKVKEGGSLTYDGTNIYALRGKDTQEFWKYDITSNTWSPMANTPDKVKDGGSLTYDGKDIYALRGKDTQEFWRYNMASGSWTNTGWVAKSGSGSYSEYISGLVEDSMYVFKAQLQYDSTIISGEVKSFTTLDS